MGRSFVPGSLARCSTSSVSVNGGRSKDSLSLAFVELSLRIAPEEERSDASLDADRFWRVAAIAAICDQADAGEFPNDGLWNREE